MRSLAYIFWQLLIPEMTYQHVLWQPVIDEWISAANPVIDILPQEAKKLSFHRDFSIISKIEFCALNVTSINTDTMYDDTQTIKPNTVFTAVIHTPT